DKTVLADIVDIISTPPFIARALMFLCGALLWLLITDASLGRSRAVPRGAVVLILAIMVTDIFLSRPLAGHGIALVAAAWIATAVEALRELVQGPTRMERASGIRSPLAPGVRLQAIRENDGIWLARFSRSLLGRPTAPSIERRLAQIEATLAPLGPERYAAI